MPAASASKEEIVDRLFTVFRDKGFEGASITDLSHATGLGKSSLYHYFPAGKEEMAEAVLERALHGADDRVLALARSSESLRMRTKRLASEVEALYSGGRNVCVLGQLATAEIGDAARLTLRQNFERWIEAVALLAADAGMPPARARHFAEDWLAQLQGALLLQAATGSTASFERTIRALLRLGKEDESKASR